MQQLQELEIEVAVHHAVCMIQLNQSYLVSPHLA